jgi:hypothetical protein
MKEAVTPEFEMLLSTIVEYVTWQAAFLTVLRFPLGTRGTDHQVAHIYLQQQGVDGDSTKLHLGTSRIAFESQLFH